MTQLTDGEATIWRGLFDLWRECYDDWPYAAHQKFYNLVYKSFPDQKRYDAERVTDALTYALATIGRPLKIWELGGWDGTCAREMIKACGDGIEVWQNVEICQEALEKSWSDGHKVYFAMSPPTWVWDCRFTREDHDIESYDIGILSHVIEHLSWKHLKALLDMLESVPYLYIQTPEALGAFAHPTAWMGTMSTHKLEVGWDVIYQMLGDRGYKGLWRKGQARFFAKQA